MGLWVKPCQITAGTLGTSFGKCQKFRIVKCEFVKNSTGKTREIKVRQIILNVKKSSKTRKFEKRQEIKRWLTSTEDKN